MLKKMMVLTMATMMVMGTTAFADEVLVEEVIVVEDSTVVADDTVVDDTVVDDTVADDTVVDDTVADDTVVDDTVVEDAVVDDTVVDDTVVDYTVVDDTVVDDTVVDDALVEDEVINPFDDIVAQIDPESITEETTLDDIIDLAIEMGLTDADGTLYTEEMLEAMLPQGDEALYTDDEVVLNAALERVAMAKELGITPGKLNIIQKLGSTYAEEDGFDVNEWLDKSVKDIKLQTKENRKGPKDILGDDVEETEDGVEETEDGEVLSAESNTSEQIVAEEKIEAEEKIDTKEKSKATSEKKEKKSSSKKTSSSKGSKKSKGKK